MCIVYNRTGAHIYNIQNAFVYFETICFLVVTVYKRLYFLFLRLQTYIIWYIDKRVFCVLYNNIYLPIFNCHCFGMKKRYRFEDFTRYDWRVHVTRLYVAVHVLIYI